jgi:predicted Zn finger-like uncharacterized protein
MALVTCCPHCATVFRVTPLHLQAHRGQVRCGQCAQVFDGFATLTTISELEAVGLANAEAGVENFNQAPNAPADVATSQQGDFPDSGVSSVTGRESFAASPVSGEAQDKASPDLGAQEAEPDGRETRETGEPFGEKPGKKTGRKRANGLGGTVGDDGGFGEARASHHSAGLSQAMQDDTAESYLSDKYPFRTTQPAQASFGWAIGSLFLLVVLALQVIYLYRADIAVIAPATKPLLEEYCELLDCTVSLPAHERLPSAAFQDIGTDKQHLCFGTAPEPIA